MNWFKSAGAKGKYYPGGFTNVALAAGSAYSPPPAGVGALDWSTGLEIVAGGDLANTWTNQITRNGNKLLNASNGKPALTITGSSGLFRGMLTPPGVLKAQSAQGVVFQKGQTGYGYFLGITSVARWSCTEIEQRLAAAQPTLGQNLRRRLV